MRHRQAEWCVARLWHGAIVIWLAAALVACGGGGGNGNVRAIPPAPPSAPPANPPSTPPSTTDQPPLDAQLAITNAYAAHKAGYTGSGVVLGIVDSGIMRDNPTLAGRVKAELIYVDPKANATNIDDVVGHGTWVSEIAAGAKFGKFPGGIAPGAELVSARIISDDAPSDHGQPASEVTAQDGQFFGIVNADLVANGVMVMNNSWGGITWDTGDAAVNQAFDQAYRDFVNVHGGLVVFAAGNGSDANPSTIAALPSVAPDLEKGWLTVVAVDSNHPDQLADYSNRCGIAMDYCLAAPGDVVTLDKDATAGSTDPDYYIVSGTSLAAPQVTGAAALVWQAFPYFDNDLVRQTLLGTADPLGGPQPNTTFGYGELDVGKAVQGPARFDWGDVSVSFDGLISTWSNDITGDGGLVKDGTGTLILAGDDSYGGGTEVRGGVLQATHPLPGDVTIAAAGTLEAAPGVEGSLDNSGRVVIAGGDTTVGGDYTQAGTATLAVRLGSKLAAAGIASLDGGTLEVTGAEDGYVASTRTDVLTAAGGVTGTFGSLVKDAGVVFVSNTIGYGSNDVWLDTTGLSITATTAALGIADPASTSAAARVQSGFDALDSRIASGDAIAPGVLLGAGAIQHTPTPAAARATLQSLSGQLHAASAAMLFDSITAGSDALSRHFDTLLVDHSPPGMWYADLGWQGDLQRHGYAAATFRSGGALLGADFAAGNGVVAGYAVGESKGYGGLDATWDHSRHRTQHVMLYGGLLRGPWYLAAHAGGGWFRGDMQRLLRLGRLAAPVGTDLSGRYQAASLEAGHRFHAGALGITPFADVRFQRLEQDGFVEQGGYGFGLEAGQRVLGRTQAGAGVRARGGWLLANGLAIGFDGSFAVRRTLHQSGGSLRASFTGFDDWQPIRGIGLSREAAELRIGVSLWPSDRFGLRLGYSGREAQQQRADSVALQGSIAF